MAYVWLASSFGILEERLVVSSSLARRMVALLWCLIDPYVCEGLKKKKGREGVRIMDSKDRQT